jgi:hypothetical protein
LHSFDIKSISLTGIGDVVFTVCTEDIQGESAGSGENTGACPDAACIFLHGDIADIMAVVLDAPMAMDGLGGFFGAYVHGANME